MDPSASSRYTLNNMGESTPPCTTPRLAENECLPMTTCDSWYILVMSRARVWSVSLLHLLCRILHSFPLSTVSYAFYRSMSAAYFLLFLPYPGWIWLRSLDTWVAVEVPSLKPVW